MVYLPTFTITKKHPILGKYTIPMDPMGFLISHPSGRHKSSLSPPRLDVPVARGGRQRRILATPNIDTLR